MCERSARYMLISSLVLASFVQADSLDEYIHLEMSQRQIPGLAFAVMREGSLIEKRVYGLANIETETPVTSSSVFELASLTKQFTATAIMRLLRAGKIDLQDSIRLHIEQAPESWQEISIYHLLTHTSGLPEEAIGMCEGMPLHDMSRDYLFSKISEMPLMFAPGQAASYSDPGYFLLGVIIESVTGNSYDSYLQEAFFAPLNMTTAHVQDQWRIVKGRVDPYRVRAGKLMRGRRDWQLELNPHFGVYASLEDMIKWEKGLSSATQIDRPGLQNMSQKAQLNSGQDALVYGVPYGFGWFIGDYNGQRLMEHGGFSGTHMVRFVDSGLTVIVLCNLDAASGSDPRIISRGIAGYVDEHYLLPHLQSAQTDPDPGLTANLQQMFKNFTFEKQSELVSSDYWQTLIGFPPQIKERVMRQYRAMESFEFVACSSASQQLRQNAGVDRVCFYRAKDDRGIRYYSLSLNDKNQILAAPSYSVR